MEPNAGNSNDKLMAYLAYIIFFIPLIVGSKSEFVKYHTNQGTVLFIFSFVFHFALSLLVGNAVFGGLTELASMISLVFLFVGIMNVAKGRMKPLPFIGGITLIK